MDMLIWTGAALTMLGIIGLFWCIRLVVRIRRDNIPDADARVDLQRAATVNMASLALSGIGLMMVVVGVILA